MEKPLRLKTQHFYAKLSYHKPMLNESEWWVQNGPITKNGVLSVTNFLENYFSLRTSYEELVWSINYPNVVLFVSAGISFNGNFSLLIFPCPRKQLAMAWTGYEKFMI